MTANGPALHPVLDQVAPSPDAAALAADILTSGSNVSDAVVAVGALLATRPGIDVVTATMTALPPEDTTGWVQLGGRAWIREWARPGATCSVVPRTETGAHQALSLPWVSQYARRHNLILVPDTQALPDEARVDRDELRAYDIGAFVAASLLADGTMFGSVSGGRSEPGPWPERYAADLRILAAALAARLATERAHSTLADAIERGDRARASQQQFFSALGHELRTPIAAILGTGDVIASGAEDLAVPTAAGHRTDAEVAGFAGTLTADAGVVLTAGEQLLAIVNSLLGTGQELGTSIRAEPVAVADALDDVAHWVNAPALTAGVTVTVHDSPPGVTAMTTTVGLRQILTNLVSNAITYNQPGGSVTVRTVVAAGETGSQRVRITVTDTGPGLTRDQQAAVFHPFVRFAGPGVSGTGLGLALSRSLAERDGGLVGVESAPGAGSAFWVDLPAGPTQLPAHAVPGPAETRTIRSRSRG